MFGEHIRKNLDDAAEALAFAVASFKDEANVALRAAEAKISDHFLVDYVPGPARIPAALPCPRLQLRWSHDSDDRFTCHYEMVFALQKGDIRDEAGTGHCVVHLGRTRTTSDPCEGGRIHLPFRATVHARLDAEQLGGLPIFLVAPDGRHEEVPAR